MIWSGSYPCTASVDLAISYCVLTSSVTGDSTTISAGQKLSVLAGTTLPTLCIEEQASAQASSALSRIAKWRKPKAVATCFETESKEDLELWFSWIRYILQPESKQYRSNSATVLIYFVLGWGTYGSWSSSSCWSSFALLPWDAPTENVGGYNLYTKLWVSLNILLMEWRRKMQFSSIVFKSVACLDASSCTCVCMCLLHVCPCYSPQVTFCRWQFPHNQPTRQTRTVARLWWPYARNASWPYCSPVRWTCWRSFGSTSSQHSVTKTMTQRFGWLYVPLAGRGRPMLSSPACRPDLRASTHSSQPLRRFTGRCTGYWRSCVWRHAARFGEFRSMPRVCVMALTATTSLMPCCVSTPHSVRIVSHSGQWRGGGGGERDRADCCSVLQLGTVSQ